MKKGLFIVLYGINNLGKSTQIKLLDEKLASLGIHHRITKYPSYETEPTGPIINEFLRKGNPYELSPREAQVFYAMNRTQLDHRVRKDLENGITIVSEDYTGTSLGWGCASGVDEDFLERVNSHLLVPDVSILLDGERFLESKEKGHRHEENDDLMVRARKTHLHFAKKHEWQIVNANQSKEKVHQDIWSFVQEKLEN